MKTLTQNSKNHGLKILCSILLLFVMTFGVLAQERVNTDKSSGYRLNVVGSDALIHGHQIGRGGGLVSSNVAIGWGTLFNNTTGFGNTANGYYALVNNTTGWANTANGYYALAGNTSGFRNTANGSKALITTTTGYNNTAIGYNSLYFNTTGSRNTANGSYALESNTTGSFNTASGHYALGFNTTGSHNTAIGAQALVDNTTGVGNTAIGNFAGRSEAVINQGTFLGHFAWVSVNNISNVSAIGFQAMANASNQVRIGNSLVTSIGGYANWTNLSDGGYKRNVEEDVAGLDFILKLRPVSYNIDVHRLAANLEEDISRTEDGNKATAVPDETTLKSRDEKAAIRYTGFIAQEVEATVNDLGVAFSGVDAPVNKNGYYGLRYADFVVPLVRAVQEQQAQIEALSPEGIDALLEELIDLRQANEHLLAAEASLRAENESIRGQIKDILSLLESYGLEIQDCCQQNTTRSDPDDGRLQPISGNARLEQNTPNPFHENTLIRYYLPEGTHRAQIIITDMAGLQVMAFPLEHQGAGQVLIHGGTLSPGSYVYTLVIDGRIADSKRMLLL